MFCPNCGTNISDHAAFCPNCGFRMPMRDVQPEPKAPVSPPPSPAGNAPFREPIPQAASTGSGGGNKDKGTTGLIIGIIIAVLIVAGLLIWLLFFKGDMDTSVSVPETTYAAEASSSGDPAFASEPSSAAPAVSSAEETPTEESTVPASEVSIDLVTSDISDYPTVKVYFRVTDMASGECAEGITAEEFILQEKLSGGAFLSREVTSAERVSEKDGISISLVADKSSSISGYDMGRIRTVMKEFIDALDFAGGDRAEVIAFDSIVQLMSSFTDKGDWLKNGIDNMYPDGSTALYDALHDGVFHAGLQGGARCVIGFTDGMDNMSYYSDQDVISYAQHYAVPIYIIGVSSTDSVDEYTLRNIASSTGGQYWNINDLQDLSDIYLAIYGEQSDLYCVCYESDKNEDRLSSRTVSIGVKGSGFATSQDFDFSFTPSEPLSKEKHESRYEVFKEDISWEDASEKCIALGGHLATITDEAEMQQLSKMCEDAGLKYVWLGGYTSYDSAGHPFGHWITGESFGYEAWCEGEPSRYDSYDNVDEWYIMLWNIKSLGGWTWNDQRNDPREANPAIPGNMGYICEYEY